MMLSYKRRMAFLLTFLVVSVAFSATVMYARSSFEGRQWATLQLARLGDARAQNNVGNRHFFGQHTPVDYPEAISWYKKAAAQGNDDALRALVTIYMEGIAAPKDEAEVLFWTEAGAKSGKGWLQVYLGSLYERGEGVGQDYQKAAEWYEKAAAQKAPYSQRHLANLYDRGLGVEQNKEKAFALMLEGAGTGDPLAMLWLGVAYQTGNGIDIDRAEAIKWFEQAVASGEPQGYAQLVYGYAEGMTLPQDFGLSLKWARQAVENRIPNGLAMMSFVAKKMKDAGPEYDTKAFEILAITANAGDPEGQLYIGDMYFEGKAVRTNWLEAANWYLKAVESGSNIALSSRLDPARERCARWVESRDGKNKDLPACFINQVTGNAAAQFAVGEAFELGLGYVDKDAGAAVDWFTKSARQGYLPAQQRLAHINASGEKITKNPVDAFAWYSIIGKRDDITEQQRVNALQGRTYAWNEISADQREAARERVKELSAP